MELFNYTFDPYLDMCQSDITESGIKKLAAKMEQDPAEGDYKDFMLRILDEVSTNVRPLNRGREERDKNNDGCREFEINEADKDPMFKAFMKSLRCHKTAYIAEYKGHGLSFDITYEPHEGLDGVHDHRKKSSMETENLSRRKSSTKANLVLVDEDEDEDDPEYAFYLERSKLVGDQPAYDDEQDNMIDHEWAPFVDFLDRATFYREVNLNSSAEVATDGSKNRSGFRRQLIGVLRKPYDEKEYERLFADIEFRPQEMRHKDLRHGREKSVPTDKYGMSYLDRYPAIARKLEQLRGDRPKCLNLLRGFFFWLEKSSDSESFCPWQDVECLSIIPESGEDGYFC